MLGAVRRHRPPGAPGLVKPLARVVGWPARRAGGVAGELASANSVRNPGRTASTAAALMIGLTLVTVVAVLGAGAAHVESGRDRPGHAPTTSSTAPGRLPFEAAEGDALARVPGVDGRLARALRQGARAGRGGDVTGIDPATIARFYNVRLDRGLRRGARPARDRRRARDEGLRRDQDLAVGEPLSITDPAGDKRAVVVRGIYDPPEIEQLLGAVSISQQAFDDAFPQPKNRYTFLDAGPGAQPALRPRSTDFSDAESTPAPAFPKDATKEHRQVPDDALRAAGLLGHREPVRHGQHARALGVRAHAELGMLRTIGMTRRQARRMIRHESVITALIGAALGPRPRHLPRGAVHAGAVEYDIAISSPVTELVAFTVVAILAGIGAAIMPARRASRLNVLDALH